MIFVLIKRSFCVFVQVSIPAKTILLHRNTIMLTHLKTNWVNKRYTSHFGVSTIYTNSQ